MIAYAHNLRLRESHIHSTVEAKMNELNEQMSGLEKGKPVLLTNGADKHLIQYSGLDPFTRTGAYWRARAGHSASVTKKAFFYIHADNEIAFTRDSHTGLYTPNRNTDTHHLITFGVKLENGSSEIKENVELETNPETIEEIVRGITEPPYFRDVVIPFMYE